MNTSYSNSFKKKLCHEVCLSGSSTSITADNYSVPLKTLEKWITAFNKNSLCFDSNDDNDFKLVKPISTPTNYDDLSPQELIKLLLKKDILIARLKKNYLVKGDGTANKEFVILSKKNMK